MGCRQSSSTSSSSKYCKEIGAERVSERVSEQDTTTVTPTLKKQGSASGRQLLRTSSSSRIGITPSSSTPSPHRHDSIDITVRITGSETTPTITNAHNETTPPSTAFTPPPLKRKLSRSSSLAPIAPSPSIFNKRDTNYPHKEQFDFLGLFHLRDVLAIFKIYKQIVIAENVQAIEDMDLGDEGTGAQEILMHQMLNSKDSKCDGPIKIRSILKAFHQEDNKFLRLVFTLHCEGNNVQKNQITFKLFVIILWNYCTLNLNFFAEYAFGLYDYLHSGALPVAKFDRMMKVSD
jgi:hypothetical protein